MSNELYYIDEHGKKNDFLCHKDMLIDDDIQDLALLKIDSSIYKTVTSFYCTLIENENHRYKSWEHCYHYFSNNNIDIDVASLHLAFYLASWGMYRGSSFLLWKDYKIHKEVVKELAKHKDLQDIDFLSITDEKCNRIIGLSDWVKNWYHDNISEVNGKSKTVNVTDTLVTKIMLGTLGCIPAYDRYFIDGIRKSNIQYSKISTKNLLSVAKFYQKHYEQFKKAQDFISINSVANYPTMKLVDMYFWQIGFERDNKG
ncbi:MAG: hypothetical protein DRQ51_05440 [Gammaproteobacteria bacterium]|nr:MAG: hypothetical protein DRQ51_05440 [Gammaproteobacteria bacterium]